MIYYVRCPECGENMDWTVTVDRDTVVAGYRCTCQDDREGLMTTTTTATTDWYCHKCGKPRWSFSDSTDTHNDMCECATQEKASGEALQGWVCPVCGRGVSPFAGTCNHGKFDYTVTT